MTKSAVVGVDVGTGSARAGIFDLSGRKLAHASYPITTWKEGSDFVEQSSNDVWRAVCAAVRSALLHCPALFLTSRSLADRRIRTGSALQGWTDPDPENSAAGLASICD
jgi:glycerol kinase